MPCGRSLPPRPVHGHSLRPDAAVAVRPARHLLPGRLPWRQRCLHRQPIRRPQLRGGLGAHGRWNGGGRRPPRTPALGDRRAGPAVHRSAFRGGQRGRAFGALVQLEGLRPDVRPAQDPAGQRGMAGRRPEGRRDAGVGHLEGTGQRSASVGGKPWMRHSGDRLRPYPSRVVRYGSSHPHAPSVPSCGVSARPAPTKLGLEPGTECRAPAQTPP